MMMKAAETSLDDFDEDYLGEDEYPPEGQIEPYTREELKTLWLCFRDDQNAVQKLADFAGCSKKEAAAMIRSFEPSAKARRAQETEAKRLTTQNTTPVEKSAERPKQPQKRKVNKDDPTITDAEISDLPPSDLLAALVNDKHGYSEIKAEGHNKSKSIIVEKFGSLFRVKRTEYTMFRDLDEAITFARNQRVHLRLF